ncbi:thermonuclease family protein [Oricola indica]|uniref:thermonuclease family protein n=1 Tax=Oricola indica TaxID=2872591 RepID=UPI001CBB4111|nr:thermonuclease family protein [Oricola indica]
MNRHVLAASALYVATTAATAGDRSSPTEPAYLYRAEVVRVVDGDTVDLDIDLGFYVWLRSQRIRMVGINAPEPKGKTREVGRAATEFLESLIVGKTVIVRTYKARDGSDAKGKYGRWLARIYVDGVDVSQAMIDAGHAVEDTDDAPAE